MTKQFKNIIFVGDIHGNLNHVAYHQKLHKLTDTLYIQCGDFGIGFKQKYKEEQTLEYYNDIFRNKNNTLYVARGNHDDPEYFNGKYKYTNIELVPDYTVKEIQYLDNKIYILFIGGAVSIDRKERKAYIFNGERGMDYWKNEIVVYNKDIVENLKNIDIVVTHTAPNICYPFINNNINYWLKQDAYLQSDILIERKILTDIYNDLNKNNNIKYWFYGHFHKNNQEIINNTKFVLIDMNDFYHLNYI
jgi:predicted phosphodiesterase